MLRLLAVLGGLALVAPSSLRAQRLTLPAAPLADSSTRSATLARLAARAAQLYQNQSPAVMQENLFHLYLLARRYSDAQVAMADWRRAWAMSVPQV